MREGCAVKINTKGWGLRNYNDYFNIHLKFNQPLMEEYPLDGWPLKSFCEVKISTKVLLKKGLHCFLIPDLVQRSKKMNGLLQTLWLKIPLGQHIKKKNRKDFLSSC